MQKQIAVLITCHNRRDVTLACLKCLFQQDLPMDIVLNVFMVDDGSSDGTGDAVKQQFPCVNVIDGNGNLFWCGGMRLAWAEAMKADYDFYLWLNDDTNLISNALRTLIETYLEVNNKDNSCGIIVGSACDPDTKQMTYGGYKDMNSVSVVVPADHPQPCITMNGNIVLVDKAVVKTIGNLSQEFQHSIADNDYGLRASQNGFSLWVAPGYQGYCKKNIYPTCFDPDQPLSVRWKALHGPKGVPPGEKLVFAKRHLPYWPLVILKLYMKMLLPRQWNFLKRCFGRPILP